MLKTTVRMAGINVEKKEREALLAILAKKGMTYTSWQRMKIREEIKGE